MSKVELLTIAALILGPILAIQIQQFIERKKQRKNKKLQIFSTLMTTRGAKLSAAHVEALNRIDVDFYDDEKVKKAWGALLDSFEHYPQDVNDPNYPVLIQQCAERSDDLLVDLLYEMAMSLEYKFDKVHLKRKVYMPKGHADIEKENFEMRQAFLNILKGQSAFPIKMV